MKIKTAFITLVAALCIILAPQLSAGAAETVSPVLPGNPLEGSQLFAAKGCLRCHSISGVGGTGGPDLGQSTLKRSLLDIAGVMWNHSPGMAHVLEERHTTRPLFKAAEMASLISFLYYIGSLEDRPGEPTAGARLFREKSCQVCHTINGKGGKHGPALDKYSRYASPIYLTVGLWNHGKAMADAMDALRVPRPTFEKNDIADLLAYFRSISGSVERIYAKPGTPRNGEKLFAEKRCVECHSVNRQGDQKRANLRTRLIKGSLMTIAGAMWNHGPQMWADMARSGIPLTLLTTEEMSDIVSYLYFLQFIDPPGVATRGRAVFLDKRCGRCHASSESSAGRAADLSTAKLGTPLEIVTEMWNHASTMEQIMSQEAVEWPVFRGGEMADLIAYLLSLRISK
ncbi:MAG TPA: c-type cytochrome [Candidatus Binatia bacterium]|nr:c-type cytochrome [Candidatus Binatia bacterium]